MNARGTLKLALGLALGSLGCTHDSGMLLTGDTPAVPIRKEGELPHKQPQPTTLVALGDLSAKNADEPQRTSIERDRWRDQARQAYQQALKADPRHLPALIGLARLYTRMEDYPRAEAMFLKAIEVAPRDAGLWYERGMCQARQKEWDAALQHLRHAVELDPEKRQYVRAVGYCLARAGRFEESFATFARLEGEAVAHYNLARMLHHLQNDELCKIHLRHALALQPEYPEVQELLAEIDNGTASPYAGRPSSLEDFGDASTSVPARSSEQAATSASAAAER